jgi:hypothetical protein
VTAFGRPLAGALVTTSTYQGIVTDGDGEFFVPVDDMQEWFHVWPPGGWHDMQTVTFRYPGQVVDVDVDLGSAGASGCVRDATTGAPIAGARIKLASAKLWPQGETDVDGRYVLGPLPPQPYTLTVEAEGYRSRTSTLDLSDGEFAGDMLLELLAQD